jgi:SAM-dependent methyltransferase
MTDKSASPRHENADVFQLVSVAMAYRYRPPHPVGVVDALLALLGPDGGAVLDAGCGTGDLGRALVDEVERVDAVDVSHAMIEEGRRLERGDHPRLRWIRARLEDAELDPPYGLVVAGDSVNWMDGDVALPRLHDVLRPGAWLALVHRTWGTGAPEETDLIRRHSVIRDYQPYDVGRELVSRGLFRPAGQVRFAGAWRPTIEEYVESRHAQAGFPRERMGPTAAAAFDRDLTDLLQRLVAEGRVRTRDGQLDLGVVAEVGWGRPRRGASA